MAARAAVLWALVFVAVFGVAPSAFAQGDEIQVYIGGLAPVGVANLTWHNNYTPNGIKEPAFPGAVISDKSWNGVTEWAYGVTRWFEAGLYLPLYSVDKDQGALYDGFKLRTLFAVPDGDNRRFVYGSNFEFSFNKDHWDPKGFSSEIRPIIGWHLNKVNVIVNPIFDTEYDGIKNLEFVPSERLDVTVSKWQLAVEHYADFGPVSGFHPAGEQAHQIFAVVDRTIRYLDIEAGVGFGLTDASDKLQLKLILARDLNRVK